MTLPLQPLIDGDNGATVLQQQLRRHQQQQQHGGGGGGGGSAAVGRRRDRTCWSAAWADPPPLRLVARERRRAICSWSVGYGTLSNELSEEPPQRHDKKKGGKVADNATLVEPRARRLVSASSVAPVTAGPDASSAAAATTRLLSMPGLKTLVTHHQQQRRRRNSETLSPASTVPLVSKARPPDEGGGSSGVSSGGSATSSILRQAASVASLLKRPADSSIGGGGAPPPPPPLRSASSSGSVGGPLRPVNRLRAQQVCSRCSSILSLASASKYSLSSSTGAFVQVADDGVSGSSDAGDGDADVEMFMCKLCLVEVPLGDACHIEDCKCSFCRECMRVYVEFEITQGAYDISCPDAQCPSRGVLNDEEIKRLAGDDLFDKHKKYRLNREIELDKSRTWCPRAGCETVCTLCPRQQCKPQSVHCPSCTTDFCSNCKLEWHAGLSCDDNGRRLAKEGRRPEEPGISFNSDLIKCCPMCNVPIEKDEGCAQMMCKRCKHVFCWYCLASLDDDFLLRHYDKGPCKNKLGHSRASVIWHRTQVIGIFAGFGILLLVASPLLLLAAPCIVCCKCRVCNAGTTKLDNEEEEEEEERVIMEGGEDES